MVSECPVALHKSCQVVKNATQDLHGSMQEGLQKQANVRPWWSWFDSVNDSVRWSNKKKWEIESIYRYPLVN